ncbi:MAG: response regulator [Burkholderiales bacterium]|nr:MAG: response regulator [Burkholderiales bacterium]
MGQTNPVQRLGQWRHWLAVFTWATCTAIAAPSERLAPTDQEWRERFVFGTDADNLRHNAKAWERARKAMESARSQGDPRVELRAAAAYFLTKPTHTPADCPIFQRYLAQARAGGAGLERELFDLGAATAWSFAERPCAGRVTSIELETLARRLGDPARMFYVLDAQAADAMAASRFGEITSIRSRQLDVAIAPFQRAKALIELGIADLVADQRSTEASRWLERAQREINVDEFQSLAADMEAGLAAVEFRHGDPAAAMVYVHRVLPRLRSGAAAPETAALYMTSFAKYLGRIQKLHEALAFLEESRQFDVDDLYTRMHTAASFLAIYAQLRTPEAWVKGEQEIQRINGWLAGPLESVTAREDAFRAIANFYERFGRLEAALKARKQLEAAMEQAQRNADDKRRIELQEQLSVALKDQEYDRLKARAELQEAHQRGWILAFGVATLGVVASGSAFAVATRRGRRLAKVSAELEQRNSELELRSSSRIRLLAAACHDLRQPAHALGMLAELGSEAQQEPTRFAAWLQRVRRSTASLGDMLDELMDLGRLDGGHYTPMLSDVPLTELMQEVMLHFGPLARRKGLTLEAPPVDALIVSDRHLLRRILFNLVSNAIKYTDTGFVRIHLERRSGEVRLTVQDSGPGIPRDKMDDVFRDYVRLNPRKAAEGLGIGLSIVRRAAELLSHPLTVSSQAGEGTSITLTLPVSASPMHDPLSLPGEQSATTGHALLAVIENDADVREAMVSLLQSWGHTVMAGSDARALLAASAAPYRAPDLVITDLHLDGTDGLAEVKYLREVLQAPGLPALLVTGDLDHAVTRQAAQAQVYVAHKPLAPLKLAALLSQLLASPPRNETTEVAAPPVPRGA